MNDSAKQKRIANLIRLAMAINRTTFKWKAVGLLNGALEHYYRCQFAKLNGQKKLVYHWSNEVERMLISDLLTLLNTATKGNWGKRNVMVEVIQEVKAKDTNRRREAINHVKKCYGLRKLNMRLPGGIEAKFYKRVQATIELWAEPPYPEDEDL